MVEVVFSPHSVVLHKRYTARQDPDTLCGAACVANIIAIENREYRMTCHPGGKVVAIPNSVCYASTRAHQSVYSKIHGSSKCQIFDCRNTPYLSLFSPPHTSTHTTEMTRLFLTSVGNQPQQSIYRQEKSILNGTYTVSLVS